MPRVRSRITRRHAIGRVEGERSFSLMQRNKLWVMYDYANVGDIPAWFITMRTHDFAYERADLRGVRTLQQHAVQCIQRFARNRSLCCETRQRFLCFVRAKSRSFSGCALSMREADGDQFDI